METEALGEAPQPAGGAPPPSKTPWIIAGAIVVAAIVVAGAIVLSSRPSSDEPKPSQTYTLKGSLEAPDCGGGYALENASVEVRDQNDKLIGSGSTGFNESYSDSACRVTFETQVPKATFYQVTVGTHSGPSYSFEEMQAQNFALTLTLD